MIIQDKQQRNWKPIIKQFEAVVGKMVLSNAARN